MSPIFTGSQKKICAPGLFPKAKAEPKAFFKA